MSPRAAWRLEALGFQEVYEYGGGKQDWLAAGLPREGHEADEPVVGDVARPGSPVCRLGDGVKTALPGGTGWDMCVVLNDEDVVMGVVREDDEADPEAVVDDVMESGASTFRPSVPVEELVEYMEHRGMDRALISDSDGKLLGVFFYEDGLSVLDERHTGTTRRKRGQTYPQGG